VSYLEREELIALGSVILLFTVLSLTGKLTHEYVQGVEWCASAFFGSKGLQGFLPDKR